jgi:hypothetical protein
LVSKSATPISMGGRLEGWQQARPNKRPSFETRRRDAALFQDEVVNVSQAQ